MSKVRMPRIALIFTIVLLSLGLFHAWNIWPQPYTISFNNDTVHLLIPRHFKCIQTTAETITLESASANVFIYAGSNEWPRLALDLRRKNETKFPSYMSNQREFFILPDPYAHRHDYGSNYTTIVNTNVAVTINITPLPLWDRSATTDTFAVLQEIRIK